MNKLMKLLVLSTLLIFIMSSANAIFQDLNAWDVNNSRHANKGEDFNVLLPEAFATDINSDFNYLIALNYGGIYVDLNVKVLASTSQGSTASFNSDGVIDANVVTRNLSGEGPCASAGDVNVLSFIAGVGNDLNTFNVSVTVPSTGQINHLVGHEVMVEIWPLINNGNNASKCGAAKVADGNFIIGPAILVYTPNTSNIVAAIDQNITIFGFGFASGRDNSDNNVQISIYDANGERLSSAFLKYQNDMNFSKSYAFGGKSVPLLGVFHRASTDLDTNSMVIDAADVNVLAGDWNGIKIWADENGEFDVNLTIPYVSNSAGSTIGRSDLNTLRAYSSVNKDVNAVFVIAPKITTAPVDMNVTVTISNNTYDLNTAMFSRLFTDFNAVSNLIVRMGTAIDDIGTREIEVKFNTGVNLKETPVADYSTDMNGRSGYVSINSTNLPEFAREDANIFMYNVKMEKAWIPFVLKDGQPCSSSICTNLDGTTLSENSTTWDYNSDVGDGNLSFKVTEFSNYEASPLTIQMLAPNGGEKIRKPRNGSDSNYTISFKFKDLNTMDNNIAAAGAIPMVAELYFSTVSGAGTGLIINDTNLFDTNGIRCNEWDTFGYFESTVDDDLNMARTDWITCVYDMTRNDLNFVTGEFLVDVNLTVQRTDINQSVLDSSDANVFFNPPLIEITDTNLNAADHFQIQGYTLANKYGPASLDINYVIDFNIYLPDTNVDNNFTLADYNIHFFLSEYQGGLTNDLNIAYGSGQGKDTNQWDQNFELQDNGLWAAVLPGEAAPMKIECTEPPRSDPWLDYNCNAQFDTNFVQEGKYYLDVRILNTTKKTFGMGKGNGNKWFAETVDVNELWDINSSTLNFTVNDSNVPRARFGTNYGNSATTVKSSSYNLTLYCDDNVASNIEGYLFKQNTASEWTTNATDTITLRASSSKEETQIWTGGCLDYAGNISDINSTITVTLKPPTSGNVIPGGGSPTGPGLPPAPVEGTETILIVEIQGTPAVEDITSTLEEAGFTTEEIATATIVAENTAIDQTVAVDKITTETGSTYQTWISIKVHNTSDKKWRNVKVIAEIPKGIASNASQINSEYSMTVLKADPIIEFIIPEIQVGGTAEIRYTTDKSISDVTARLLPLGMVTAYTEVAPCDGVTCEIQICATGECNPATGICDYEYYEDGISCGDNKWCQSGACVEKATTPPEPPIPPEPPVDYTLPIVAIIIIILVVIGAAAYYMKTKGKGK